MFDSASVVVDLLLHLTLVFLQVSESLLQPLVLLLLRCERRVVGIASQLQLWHDVRHIVLIHCFQNVPHLFNLSPVSFGQFLVFLELLVGVDQLTLELGDVVLD